MFKHYNITISGKVQMVGYRNFLEKSAKELNIKGFVQNMPNGNVYIEAEGEEENLTEFLKFCKNGPKRAEVIKMDIKGGLIQNFKVFDIKF